MYKVTNIGYYYKISRPSTDVYKFIQNFFFVKMIILTNVLTLLTIFFQCFRLLVTILVPLMQQRHGLE